MKKTLLLSTCLITPLFIQPATAQEETEVIVVSATRTEQPLSNIGSSISVVTAEDIELSQVNFLHDALIRSPGVNYNQNGTFGGVSSLRIRGAKQVTFLIDGVQVNDPSTTDGTGNYANFDVNAIEQIEVLRGSQSILYGSDAMGGVVNVITKSGQEGFGGSAFVEGGSFNTFSGGGNIYGGTEQFGYSLSARTIDTDGISKADENDGNTERDGYKNTALHGKFTGNLTENFKTEFIGRYNKSRSEYDAFGPIDGDQIDHTTDYLIANRNRLELLDGRFTNTLSFELSQTKREGEATDGTKTEVGNGKRINIDYFGHYKVNDMVGLSFGLQHEETEASSASDRKFNIDSIVSEVSFQGIENLTVTAGGRYDNHSQYGDTFSPRVTAAYYMEDSGTKIYSNWAEGFKAPSIYQLSFFCCGLTEPNPNLLPEESTSWEVGIEQEILGEDIVAGITYFDQKTTNLIDFSYTAGYDNIAEARSKGIEVFIDAEINEMFSFAANYTYTDATDVETGDPLPRVPKNTIFAELRVRPIEELFFSFSVTHNDESTDPYSPTVDAWTRADFRTSYTINENFEIYARIDNLFDKEYQQVYGYGTPDRSYYGGVRAKF
ncbi:TonB-dependent receptor plug domain-containing protein [Pseudemcibacter aquimaris]|uniref:TonB-dependent receptor plug domain-containing protein n=1 Tax=Pseudemcibacter aquimaris TaxID=2857064 RepID=UPI0020119E69|nr:TonB-dependent receptor [Pseudemcibacter aquimaris]MCC3861523.1 TonB-dependent receptor [Pseudemcibacter aquimaris]WDU58292.1 TonB-dependent receptor [Pseudemcibacter aquimaris]